MFLIPGLGGGGGGGQISGFIEVDLWESFPYEDLIYDHVSEAFQGLNLPIGS